MTGSSAHAPAAHPRLVLGVATLATAMAALDLTIAGIALPHMRGTFSATQDQVAWVITSFIVAAAVTIPCTGWLAGRYGRKRLFVTALVGFTIISVLCGTATSLIEEVAFRFLQGAFGAPLVPLAQAIILDTFPREKHGQALAVWGLGIMLGPVVGPTVGGYLIEEFGWPWIFYLNIPFGLITILGALAFVPETEKDRSRVFDWFGFAALGAGIAALQLMLDRGERQDWFEALEIVVEGTVVALAFYIFIVHTLTAEKTFLNKSLLQDRNFAVGLLLVFAFGFLLLPPLLLLLPPLLLLPAFLQDLRGFPVATAGLVLAPRGLGVMVGMTLAGRLINRVDPRLAIGIGLLGTAAGTWPMVNWTLDVGWWDVVWTGFVQGAGLGLFYVPMFALAFSTLPPRYRTEGTGLFQLMRNIGSSISVSIFATLLARNTTVNYAVLAEHINPFNRAFADPSLSGAWALDRAQGLAALDVEVTRQATMIAYANDFYLLVICTLATLPLLLLLRPANTKSR